MLSIILKGTNGCNLACSYCSLGKKKNIIKTTREMMYEIMKYACELCKEISEKDICFILHGGEPTVVDSSVYNYAIEKIKKEYADLYIKISMQTNGYYLSEEWIDFFIQHNVSVGVSIDGAAAIHDKERKAVDGGSTFSIVQRNIEQLLEQGINVACLMVLTSNALEEGYGFLDYYAEKHLHLKINPLLDYGEAYEHPELSLKPGQYADYMIGMYEYILKENVEVGISPIDRLIQGVLSDDKKIRACSFDKECNKHFLCIDFNGDIYPCGRFSDMGEFCIGNIADGDYKVFESDIICRLVSRRNSQLPQKCRECKYKELCNAGCNAEACINGALYKNPAMCNDYFKLFDYFSGKGLALMKEELLKQRERLVGLIENGI